MKWDKNKHLIFRNKKLILATSRIKGRNTLKLCSFIRLFLNLNKSNFYGLHQLGRLKWVPCPRGVARPQVEMEKVSRYGG
jgi:hypothetical protein